MQRRDRAALVERRIGQLRVLLEQRRAAAVLVQLRRNFAWLTVGGMNHVVLATEEGAAPLLVTRDEAVVLSPINEAARIADEELADLSLPVVALDWFDLEAPLNEARRRLGDARLLTDTDLEDDLVPLRSTLDEVEAERLRWLGERVRGAMEAALCEVTAGESEDAAVARALAQLGRDGVRAPVLLAAADERIERYRHPLPSGRAVERRLMLVVVAERWGLHVAATRFRELVPPDRDLRARLAAVADVLAAMRDATTPGRTFGDVLAAAQLAYAATGYPGEWKLHHQGGSIGYQGRERIAVPDDATPIERAMAFAWNPSITGAKAEETLLLASDGSLEVVTG